MANTKKADEEKLKQRALGLSDNQIKEIDAYFTALGQKSSLSAFVRMSLFYTIQEGHKSIEAGEGLKFWNDLPIPF